MPPRRNFILRGSKAFALTSEVPRKARRQYPADYDHQSSFADREALMESLGIFAVLIFLTSLISLLVFGIREYVYTRNLRKQQEHQRESVLDKHWSALASQEEPRNGGVSDQGNGAGEADAVVEKFSGEVDFAVASKYVTSREPQSSMSDGQMKEPKYLNMVSESKDSASTFYYYTGIKGSESRRKTVYSPEHILALKFNVYPVKTCVKISTEEFVQRKRYNELKLKNMIFSVPVEFSSSTFTNVWRAEKEIQDICVHLQKHNFLENVTPQIMAVKLLVFICNNRNSSNENIYLEVANDAIGQLIESGAIFIILNLCACFLAKPVIDSII